MATVNDLSSDRMDLAALERALAASEVRPLLLDERLLRRVIKRHRLMPGFGLQVPHARCYSIPRAALTSILSPHELGRAPTDLPEDVILLPRPDPRDLSTTPAAEVLISMWRDTFHARVHLEIERAARAGELTPARLRERAHRIGQTEIDEIRRVLLQDDLLLPPHEALDAYAELSALYLELTHFAPELVRDVFPALDDRSEIAATIAEDVDAARLLEACRPEGAPASPRLERKKRIEPEEAEVALAAAPRDTLHGDANDARRRGNAVRSAFSWLRLAASEGADAEAARAEARADISALVKRLDAALAPPGEAEGAPPLDRRAWETALLALAERAAKGGPFRWIEARLLYDLQRACLASERAIGKVDLVDFALSFGKRPLARMLPATRPIRVAREIDSAVKKLGRVRIGEVPARKLGALLADARRRADDNIRASLRPVVLETLHEVGLRPVDVPEQIAQAKLVEELLDQATARGHLGIGPLRDAISRNQLKLADLSGPGELWRGDPLLLADRKLSRDLDGVHRRGEIYMRGLQKLSSLLFGTGLGRLLTRYLLLPFGSAFVLLEGVGHMVNPIGHALHLLPRHHHVHLLTPVSFVATAAVIFALIHSAPIRNAAIFAARAIGFAFATVFFHAPRWLLTRPLVRAIIMSPAAFALRRYVLKPCAIAAGIALLTPLRRASLPVEIGAAAGIFVISNATLNSHTGAMIEEIAVDSMARSWRRLRRHVLPGLFRLIADFFRQVTDSIDQGIYAVDEWLRFREGQSRAVLAAKAVLGLVWFAIAYLVRIYINLLIEPQVNPIKHFPVVTVAAKIMLPLSPTLIPLLHGALSRVFGGFIAGTLAAPTILLLPGVAGFLVWEFKENYKLYRKTRTGELRPVPIGHHGETMAGLLKPGFHSGTLPKLWSKLRRAAKKGDGSAEKHEEAMREIREAVERFVDREMLDLLTACPIWRGGLLHVAQVELASNRIRVHLARGTHGDHDEHGEGASHTTVIAFEEQSGWLLASVPRPGFLADLSEGDRVLFENALAGLYHLAGVDLVREQLEATLHGSPPYDIADEGLVVWPSGAFATELVYPLEGKSELVARIRGDEPKLLPQIIHRQAIMFREQPIAWTDWVAAWSSDVPRRILKRTPLLRLDFHLEER